MFFFDRKVVGLNYSGEQYVVKKLNGWHNAGTNKVKKSLEGVMKLAYETVIAERIKDGRVGIMTLNRPDKLNAWNSQLVEDMTNCLKEFKNDANMNVVIVKGAGKHFCAGMDLAEVLDKSGDEILAFFKKCFAIRTLMQSMPQITIAVTHGIVAAFGIHLVWFCDLAVSSEDASFGAPPINVGFG